MTRGPADDIQQIEDSARTAKQKYLDGEGTADLCKRLLLFYRQQSPNNPKILSDILEFAVEAQDFDLLEESFTALLDVDLELAQSELFQLRVKEAALLGEDLFASELSGAASAMDPLEAGDEDGKLEDFPNFDRIRKRIEEGPGIIPETREGMSGEFQRILENMKRAGIAMQDFRAALKTGDSARIEGLFTDLLDTNFSGARDMLAHIKILSERRQGRDWMQTIPYFTHEKSLGQTRKLSLAESLSKAAQYSNTPEMKVPDTREEVLGEFRQLWAAIQPRAPQIPDTAPSAPAP